MTQNPDIAFVKDGLQKIPGWLYDYAALRTIDLMRRQTDAGVKGPAFEIGVYAGRYFSVMLRQCLAAGDGIVGLDMFHRVSTSEVRAHLAPYDPGEKAILMSGPSTSFSAAQLWDMLGAPPRFISIDGSHMLADVRHDLDICSALLADAGIMACDDFLNPVRMGVGQAIHEFVTANRSFAPFAYIQNKLFICRAHHHEELFALAHQICAADPTDRFAANAQSDPGRNQTQLYGWDLVTIPTSQWG